MMGQTRMLWQAAAGFRVRYACAIGAICIATLFTFVVPLVGRAAIDGAIARSTGAAPGSDAAAPADANTRTIVNLFGGGEYLSRNLWLAAGAMVLLTALAGLFTYLKGRWAAQASEGVCRRLRDRLFDHLQHLPCRYHDKADTGDAVQRCTSDVETMRLFMSVQVVEIGNALIILAACVPIMLMLDAAMTAASLMFVPIIIAFAIAFFLRVKMRFRAVDEAEAKMTTVIQENLTGIRVVRAFAQQEYEKNKFAGANGEYRDRSFRLVRLLATYWTTSDLFCLSQLGIALGVGAYWLSQGRLSVGTLYAFLAYLHLTLFPVRQMGRILTDLGKAVVAMGRMQEILSEPEERDSAPAGADSPAPPQRFDGALTIRGLTFAYDGDPAATPVLRDVSIDVQAGQTLALLGPSGAGKSTLVHLLLRLYDYGHGRIELDGHELRDLPRKLVRSQMGVVLQEPFLFSKSLGANIRHGRADARDAQITAAAEAACIHETIASMQQGYATVIGERGVNLSGGQRQRVAIARALVRDPAVLILDDALSAVDSQTESMILDALRQRRGKRTTIIIAHRLSALMHADRIVVLDKGRVVQAGTHEQLVDSPGIYRRLWSIQTSLAEDLERDMQTVSRLEQS